jgi:hypothetical protein
VVPIYVDSCWILLDETSIQCNVLSDGGVRSGEIPQKKNFLKAVEEAQANFVLYMILILVSFPSVAR